MSSRLIKDRNTDPVISTDPIEESANNCQAMAADSQQDDKYDRVPAKRSFAVNVDCNFRGRKMPSPYPVDEE
jgi:hypothetical protein